MKKALIITVLVVSVSFIAIQVYADNYYRYEKANGVSVTEDGIITWDACPGAETYWVGINNQFIPFELGASLSSHSAINGDGEYEFEFEACDEDGQQLAEWIGVISVSGGKYSLKETGIITEAETEAATEAETEAATQTETETEAETDANVTTEKSVENTDKTTQAADGVSGETESCSLYKTEAMAFAILFAVSLAVNVILTVVLVKKVRAK